MAFNFNWLRFLNVLALFGKLRVAKSDRLDPEEKELANDAIDAVREGLTEEDSDNNNK